MWRFITLFPVLFILNTIALAQVGTTPTPTPRPGSREASMHPISADSRNFDRMQAIEMLSSKGRTGNHPLLDPKKGIYREPGKDEIEILSVSEPLLAKYVEFLNGPNTGIVKLNGDSSCISDADVVVATEACVAFKMPGAGTAYSFRTESYRLPRLADVILLDGIFRTGGVFQQVLIAEIGDVAIEDVTLATSGLKYLSEVKPVRDSDEFTRFDAEIQKGIKADGFLYRKAQLAKENSTFVLRSIAYRGEYFRAIDGIKYNELDFDKRRDVIVAFRVIDKDASGNVTIAWKQLKNAESPKLKVKK